MFFQASVSVQSQIIDGLHAITDAIAKWVVPLAAIASVSMAFLQTIKNQTPVRNWYQRFRIRTWLRDTIRGNFSESSLVRWRNGVTVRFCWPKEVRQKEEANVNDLERKLISLATSGDKDAFYDLQIEDLCDQIRKIVSIILDYPASHEMLLRCLARGADSEDIELLLTAARTELTPPEVQSNGTAKQEYRKIAAAKSRVLAQVRCSVDAMQISIGFRWKFYLQFASMILSAIVGYLAVSHDLIATDKGGQENHPSFLGSVLIGFLAGFLAPISRDLVATIEQWRK